jgi:hypothetical protein
MTQSDTEFQVDHAGVITGPEDPEAIFCACLIRDFGATVILKATRSSDSNPDGKPPPGVLVPGKPYTPTEEQRRSHPVWGQRETSERSSFKTTLTR